MRAEYLLLMAACLAITLPLEFWLRARVYRRPVRLLLALAPALVVFYVWDAVAIARGHWDYSPSHTVGLLLPGSVPLEELVFFLVIPICGLLTYEAVGTVLGRSRGGEGFLQRSLRSRRGTSPRHEEALPVPEDDHA
jgi:lycopene cyclase domain-containing protein